MAPVSSSAPVESSQENRPLSMSFTNVQGLFDVITSTKSDFLRVTGIVCYPNFSIIWF